MKFLYSLIASLLLTSPLFSQGTQLLRDATVSSTDIIFVYANDLWKVNRDGGDAKRLTTDEGYESLPHYSFDEKWVAFSAQYEGNTDVYVVSADGGIPKRLTFHPGSDYVQGWTPEGEVIFRSAREAHPTQINKLYTIGVNGGMPVSLEIPRAAYGEISPDGQQIAYVPITSWDPEWRNYRGGQAMPIWIVDLESKELTRTPQPSQERHLDPVWFKDKVYYISERDYAANIWSFDPKTQAEEQITFHKKFDVKSLDACSDRIVYEQGGYLHMLNPDNGEAKQLEIAVKGDMTFSRKRWENVNGSDVTHGRLSPRGKRAIFEYRGEIFTFPKEEGSWRNLSKSPGVADRYPVWSPQGDKIAWFSDASGEYQLVVADQYGENKKIFPLKNPTFYFEPDWSPDGKHLAYTDTDYNLWYINLSSGKVTKVDTDRYAHPNRAMNPVWSPDSKWIAYARQLDSHYKAVFAYNIESGDRLQLTDGMADAITPVWDQNGKYLYFLASTDYGLNTGWLDMSSYDPDITRGLYCLVLSKDDASPLLIKSDEEEAAAEDTEKENVEKKPDVTVRIDPNQIDQRIVSLPLPLRNYQGLVPGPEGHVFVAESVPHADGLKIHDYDVMKGKPTDYAEGVRMATASSDGNFMLIRKGSNWSISSSSAPPKPEDALAINAKIQIDPKAEYEQIFREGWRYMRDFLYVDNVHGAPWDQIYEWYAPWIEDVQHRTDLNYMVDIMSGEVAVGHSYVSGGDLPDIDYVPVGLLGCDFTVDNGRYRIDKIYTGENWFPDEYAPLAQPGLQVAAGDYLLAVNGVVLTGSENVYELFEQTANRTTRLTVGQTTEVEEGQDIWVKPVRSEYGLRTIDWMESNRRKVDEMSDGKLAYVYIPNTGSGGFESFNRYYFAQQDKKGVVLDERNNGGGSAADYMIDVLSRELFGYFNSKAGDNRPWTTPMAGIWGPKVMLINERSGSGGDLLPYMFKQADIGPLVGTRTWGGLVGTWDTPRFIDGGRMVAPRGGFFDKEGEWAVEGEGVAPDFEVIQEPKLVLEGRDPQLEKAVKVAMELLRENEFQMKPEPTAPVRWKRPEGFDKE